MVRTAPPILERQTRQGVSFWTDPGLAEEGVRIAFTERAGGVSVPPYDSLDLAAHVGDDPGAVDANRKSLMRALGIEALRDRLVTAEQVHGTKVTRVDDRDAGRGASADGSSGRARPPIDASDGLATIATDLPLLLLFADCVPVVLAVTDPVPGVAVVHAGWRGALERIPAVGVSSLLDATGASVESIRAYIGPHIGRCCYKVATTLLTRFTDSFGTICAVDGRLDLTAVVRASLREVGVTARMIAQTNVCTMDDVDRYFSYRASEATGRHGALAVITKG